MRRAAATFDTLGEDVRWALRTMRRNRGLTLVLVLSLALAIGANTAVFSVFSAFLLRPLGIRDVDRVVRVYENYAPAGEPELIASVTGANYYRWIEHPRVFEGLAAGTFRHLHATGFGDPERVAGAAVTWNFFRVLGIEPAIGRDFVPEEDRPGARRVVLLGYAWWTSRFGGDPRVSGRILTLDGEPFEVIGVMPRGLRHPYDADMWVPLALEDRHVNGWGHYAPARLAGGVSLEEAEREMSALVRRLAGGDPPRGAAQGVVLAPLRGELLRDLPRLVAMLLVGAGVLLLIACVNVSNLLLAQSLRQSAEVAIRVALGATRGRLVRQFLTYSVLLALLGGGLGLVLAFRSVGPLVALASDQQAVNEFDVEPRLDVPTLAFTAASALGVGLLFGLLPALRASTADAIDALRHRARSTTLGLAGRHLLAAFIVAEVALALVLLTAAGSTFDSLRRVVNDPRGFDLDQVLSFQVALPGREFPDPPRKVDFVRDTLHRLRGIPGVTAAGATTTQPLFPGTYTLPFNPEGRPARNAMGAHLAHDRVVTPGYFESLDIPLLRGRAVSEQDTREKPMVAVISQSMADRYWPGEDAIGRRLKAGPYEGPGPWITVVGIAGNLAETSDEQTPVLRHDALYRSYQQATPRYESMTFTIEAAGSTDVVAAAARDAVSQVNRGLPIFDLMTMDARLSGRTAPQRFSAWLYGGLAGMGLLLAVLGIYGILSFSMTQRIREIGVRLAVGARPEDVRALLMGRAAKLTAAGVALGAAATAPMRHLLPFTPESHGAALMILALSSATVVLAALASSYIPARRAARTPLMEALRSE